MDARTVIDIEIVGDQNRRDYRVRGTTISIKSVYNMTKEEFELSVRRYWELLDDDIIELGIGYAPPID